MTQETLHWLETVRPALNEHFDQLRYAQAATLGRAGRYLEAEALLAPGGNLPHSARELDLLARLAARQRQYHQARRLWLAVLEIEPHTPIYMACLAAVDQAERRQALWRAGLLTVSALALALSLALLAFAAAKRSHSFPANARPHQVARTPSILNNRAVPSINHIRVNSSPSVVVFAAVKF
jgi:tetratricopeptide (TPR) repeat protein